MRTDLVTVVIPVYNVEKYLDRCINSVVNQSYRNLEIILVDDGSTDGSPRICDAWARKDSRIRVIHKQNEGQGIARNVGIENAFGEYICFFDSDDYVDTNTIREAYAAAVSCNAEMVCFGVKREDADGKVKSMRQPAVSKTVYRGEEVCKELLPLQIGPDPKTGENADIPMGIWSKLISMKAIQRTGWRFVSEREIISEDFYSLLALYRDLEAVCIVPQVFYHYCENAVSFTHFYRPDRFEKVGHFYREIIALCHRMGYSQAVADRLGTVYLSFVISAMKQEFAHHEKIGEAMTSIRAIVDDSLLQQVLRERKEDKQGTARKILFFAMRHKLYLLCYTLLKAKNTTS